MEDESRWGGTPPSLEGGALAPPPSLAGGAVASPPEGGAPLGDGWGLPSGAPYGADPPYGADAPGVRDSLRDGPVYPVGTHPHLFTSARLREAHPVERAVRVVLVLLVVGTGAAYAQAWLGRPRVVHDQTVLLRDATAGRVVRVDARGAEVRWRNRNGAVYESEGFRDPADVRASVAAQAYVRNHPDSVTYGRIDRPEPPGAVGATFVLVELALIGVLLLSPQPRVLTRWGWFWTLATGVGMVAFLLFGGSTFHGRPGAPPRRRRVDGWQVWLALFVLNGVLRSPARMLFDAMHPVDTTGPHGSWVHVEEQR